MQTDHYRRRFHIIFACMITLVVYGCINMIAITYLDERNGVINGQLTPNSDHAPLAGQIIRGERITYFFLPPGFSLYIISATKMAESLGGSYFFWRLIQDSLSAVTTTVLVMLLVLRLCGSLWIAWGASLVLLFNLSYSAGTATDVAMAAFMPWFAGSLLLLIAALEDGKPTGWRAFFSGVLLACSGYIRPDVLLFLPFLGVMVTFFRFAGGRLKYFNLGERLSCALIGKVIVLASVGFIITVLPWSIFATMRAESFVIYSTNFAASHIDGMSRFPDNSVSQVFEQLQGKGSSTRELIKIHLSLLQERPSEWLALWLAKFWRPWYASNSHRWDWIFAVESLFLLPFVIGGMLLWIKRSGVDLGFTIAIAVIVYFWLICLSVVSMNRYMPPAYPFLGMFVGLAAANIFIWAVRSGSYSWLLRQCRTERMG